MTTLIEHIHADVRPDVRTSVRRVHPKHRRPSSRLRLRSNWWLVFIVGSFMSLMLILGTVAHSVPQTI